MAPLDVFLFNLLIHVVVNIILLAPVLWISGRLLAGKEKARFLDALWIAILGTVIADLLGLIVVGTFGLIVLLVVLVVWVALIKHFFDCGWLKALAIGIVAIIMLAVIAIILALLGIAILTFI